MHQVKIEKFQGPLALLLDLIESNKLDITEVSLAEIADQYLAALAERREAIGGEELADFLLLAAKLLVIKSRALLPSLEAGEDEGRDLEAQLRMYKSYRDAACHLAGIIKEENFLFGREPLRRNLTVSFSPPPNLPAAVLARTLWAIIKDLEHTLIKLPKERVRRILSLSERITHLRAMLVSAGEFGFRDFLKGARNKAEVVVSFLALLELVKQRQLLAVQAEYDIVINKTSP